MIPDSVIAEVRNASVREVVARDVRLLRAGREWRGLCPFHVEKTPSFFVNAERFHCFGCGAHGDAIGYLMRAHQLDFAAAVRELSAGGASDCGRRIVDNFHLIPVRGPKDPDRKITDLWSTADAPSIAEFYLRSRGLLRHGALPSALRGHRRVLYAEACGPDKPIVEPSWRLWRDDEGIWWRGMHKPAMLAAVTDAGGRITALQQIWCERSYEVDASRLGPQDARAVGLAARKKTRGHIGTGAIRLAKPTTTLGIAEGVETALAAAQLFRFPVWALAGVTRMGFPAHWGHVRPGQKPVMWFQRDQPDDLEAKWIDDRPPAIRIPAEIKRLYVFGDRGEVGERAADYCAWWHRRNRSLDAQPVLPSDGYDDWNSELLGRMR